MISAKEAANISETRHKELLDEYLSFVDSRIKSAAAHGETNIVLDSSDIPQEFLVSKEFEELLKAEGYAVRSDWYFPEACCVEFYLTISWPKKRKEPISWIDRFMGFCFG